MGKKAGILLFFAAYLFLFSSCPSLPPPEINPDLKITEVGSMYYADAGSWIELYNSGSTDIQLSQYKIRTHSVMRTSPYSYMGINTFSLPSLTVPPGAYILVRGNIVSYLTNGARIVYILISPNTVPYWEDLGFVELMQYGQTIDFVRFGSDTTTPTTEGWAGGSAPALPNSAADYGKSLARDGSNTDTDTEADWTVHSYGTAGGPNDVTSDLDADLDGIPDCSEVSGSTFAGLPLYDWGARTGQKDLFIHIDYMQSSDPGVTPRKEALDKVVAAFAAKNYYLHFDVGNLYGSGPSNHNLDNTSHQVPFNQAAALGIYGSAANLYDYKNTYMNLAKKQIFHYMLFAYSQELDGSGGSSGIAELNGNDVIITLGNWGLTTTPTTSLNQLINYQAATVMHEFGHNLGLRHGGNEDMNYKPNYYSIMNYMYQLNGLPTIGNANEGDRYYWYRYSRVDAFSALSKFKQYLPTGNFTDLHNNCTDDPSVFKMDYSNGNGGPLDEALVNEPNGLQRSGSAPIDYNGDGDGADTNFDMDLNNDTGRSNFTDYDDWSHLNLFFVRTHYGDLSGISSPAVLRIWSDPVGNDRQEVIVETLTAPKLD
ncbi:MAG: hypothetical protein JW969_02300 [Spirochaetales bacterium]|nr:hypothetical protein [Spirochaetales bacterium]